MNFTCIICSDLIASHDEVYTTHCGHVFHYTCLIQWLERSKTCPQCRNKASERNIHRIFLNFANSDPKADAVTLQSNLDNAQFQLRLKEKDIKNFSEKYSKVKHQNTLLRSELLELENKARTHNSVVLALKDQILFFKSKAKETEKHVEEISKLKARIKQMESIEIAVNGSREEVTEMLKNGNDVDSLVILVATLKKALLDAEKKKINTEHKLKQMQNELTSNRRENMLLEMSNKDLKKELEFLKTSSGKGQFLAKIPKRQKQKVKMIKDDELSESSPTLFLDQSVLPSPSLGLEDDEKPLSSNSPYLNLKKCSTLLDLPSQRKKTSSENSLSPKHMSIFRKCKPNVETAKSSKVDSTMYNGLGGQSKEDLFPTPKIPIGFKRRRVEPTTSYQKFRKMDLHLTCRK